jgi:hypothetical protein
LTAVLGDVAISADGRSLKRTSGARAWAQQTQAAFSWTAGTYRYDKNAGFPASVTIFTESITEDLLSNLVRYALSLRPDVVEVETPAISRDGRTWVVQTRVRLTSGAFASVNFTL